MSLKYFYTLMVLSDLMYVGHALELSIYSWTFLPPVTHSLQPAPSNVTRYIKTDHLQFFSKFAFLVRIDAEFTVEFNGRKARL